MEPVRVTMVAEEEHVAYERVQTVTHVVVPLYLVLIFLLLSLVGSSVSLLAAFRAPVREVSLDLALSVELRAHAVVLTVLRLNVMVTHELRTVAEHTVEHPVGDERSGEQLFLPVQSVALDLLACHAERRLELSEQSVDGILRNLPYTEEAEHMVNAVSIEELSHILEAANPPQTAVLKHFVPVVGRESPVLTVCTERIRWSASLPVEIEVARLSPHVAAIAVDTDRNIALEDNALLTGIVVNFLKLSVQDVLLEVVEAYSLVSL